MKAKNHEKLAGFEREFIDSKISEKPVKSRIFGNLQGVENAPRGLLLSERSRVRIAPGMPKSRQLSPSAFRFDIIIMARIPYLNLMMLSASSSSNTKSSVNQTTLTHSTKASLEIAPFL